MLLGSFPLWEYFKCGILPHAQLSSDHGFGVRSQYADDMTNQEVFVETLASQPARGLRVLRFGLFEERVDLMGMKKLTVLELCAGAGGQALGFEAAGYAHVGLVEIDKDARNTLRLNRPEWNVIEDQSGGDITKFDARKFRGTDVLAAGLPCPPFSKAGKQLGVADERNLFPAALRIIKEVRPKAILIENVSGILDPKFRAFREEFASEVEALGYATDWKPLNASDFGVPQLRPRVAFVAVPKAWQEFFTWPKPGRKPAPTVGEALFDLMAARGWTGATEWSLNANSIAPTLVGGSKKHGGPDLGPTRAKREWAKLGVNGHLIAKEAPEPGFAGMPHLTIRMAARIQGFRDEWRFEGAKTSNYRQVGNAFPPPVACALAKSIARCIETGKKLKPGGGVLRDRSRLGLEIPAPKQNGYTQRTSSFQEHEPYSKQKHSARDGGSSTCSCIGVPFSTAPD